MCKAAAEAALGTSGQQLGGRSPSLKLHGAVQRFCVMPSNCFISTSMHEPNCQRGQSTAREAQRLTELTQQLTSGLAAQTSE